MSDKPFVFNHRNTWNTWSFIGRMVTHFFSTYHARACDGVIGSKCSKCSNPGPEVKRSDHNNEVRSMGNGTAWRITKPLRQGIGSAIRARQCQDGTSDG